ncbi:hypothetical protein D3C72_2051130 [compost metagenome]
MTREALIAISRFQRKQDLTVVLLHDTPAAFVKPFRATVKLVFTLAWQKRVLCTVERKTAFRNAVRVTAHGRAEIRGLIRILFRRRAAEQRFTYAAVRHRNTSRK